MTALPTDFSVTSNRGTPTPNPDWPIDSPFAVTAVSAASVSDPSALSAIAVVTISTPVAWTAEAVSGISSPSSLLSVTASSISTPTAKTPVAKATVTTPTALTATSGTATTPPFPMNHARILYDNLLFNYDNIAITDGTNGNYALIPNTYKGWEFTHDGSTTVSWTLTMPANVNMDTFCIGAHNLADIGATVEVFYDVDATAGGLVSVGSATPANGTPLMFHLSSSVSVRRVKLEIDSAVAGNIKIGYISAGIALQLQRPFFGGHTPITMGDNTVYRNNMTDGGEFTSRSIIRKGFSNSVSIENVDRTWIQSYFLDFKEVSKEYLYFIAWNLLEYPEEVGLCMTGGDISLQFSGTRDLMSINWSQTGHGSV